MRIGVDYYPEQWDRSLWERDAEIMARTGVKIVRLAEFAWSRLEPQDGVFNFEWLDDVIRIFSRFAIGIVLGIPTNCPPLWMYEQYPDIVQVDPDGKPKQLGIRGHRCLNNDNFRRYAYRITEQMVRRYGSNQAIVAWQIDNELEAYPCCCETCKGKFRQWLMDKYGDLNTINAAFGNSVWSGEYSSVNQIQPPNAYPLAWQNPALNLEWFRFTAHSTDAYVRDIALVIRKEVKRALITTNTWFCENMPDFYKLFADLDFVSYDNYPPIKLPAGTEQYYSHAFHLDFMRGIKEDLFWVMEQLSGPTGSWAPMSMTPRPGQIMGYALQAMAHGADTVVHFRWRTAVTGAEMHWHGILDHSNVPNRRYNEFSELCKAVTRLNILDNTTIISDIAILYSPESEFALRAQPQVEGFYYLEQLMAFHRAFMRYGANVDVVSPKTDLSGYKLVIAPALYVNKPSVTENLYRYVIKGGTLVLTNRSGVKNEYNNCIMDSLPTVFKELIGAEISEYDPIGNNELSIRDFAGNVFVCREWCDLLQPTTAKTYAEYNDGFYRCIPAVTMNRYCAGVTYYVGTVCESDFYESFAGNLMMQTGIPRLMGLPFGVEVTTRTNGRDEYICFFNNSEKIAVIPLPKPMFSMINSVGKDKLELKPFEMEVVRK